MGRWHSSEDHRDRMRCRKHAHWDRGDVHSDQAHSCGLRDADDPGQWESRFHDDVGEQSLMLHSEYDCFISYHCDLQHYGCWHRPCFAV